jgi:hypothetical protein
LYGRYLKDYEFQDFEYEVHQVGLKDFGSQNFSFLAVEGAKLASTQFFSTTVTATARDRRKFFYRSNQVIYS